MEYFTNAADAIADKSKGARTLRCTLSEAFKLAGIETVDVNGNCAWYCTPINYAPGTKHDDHNGVWNIAVSRNLAGNTESISVFRKAHDL